MSEPTKDNPTNQALSVEAAFAKGNEFISDLSDVDRAEILFEILDTERIPEEMHLAVLLASITGWTIERAANAVMELDERLRKERLQVPASDN